MHSFTAVATFALVASASIVSAAPIACRGKPDNYVDGYLEDYDTYHVRYIALDCHSQHNTTFFDDCCHPLLANETLADNRLAYCTPNTTAVAEVTSTIVASNATATATGAVEATTTASADVDAASEYSAAETSTSAVAESTIGAVAEYAHHGKQSSSSSSSEAAPTSTTEAAWTAEATSTSSAAAETSSAASSSGSSDVKTGGFATFFYQGGNAGACGTVHSDSDKVIAIDSNGYWSDFSQPSQYCGKYITITNTNNGKTVTAMVADVCPTCVSDNSLDLSVGAFTEIASEDDGSVPITWVWA
ncbi:hypothetical protein I302_102121 [Kwoniella bestiolae CBS 10118]|uniref:RlpA-like protein double-psi beta-barrel domain-containing protein n=1 Tax=Kwoniella bestiolae CBS 10118 TaxID=1296100 RepID=A0A1B9GE52_9TREE|nr:hypothetical protein I302_00810 [Kwoniella bestiolae CBS 10118]OCF29309.1 hypothetical protein I302_00810 [Kwoniella bestiolae CBS 10118]